MTTLAPHAFRSLFRRGELRRGDVALQALLGALRIGDARLGGDFLRPVTRQILISFRMGRFLPFQVLCAAHLRLGMADLAFAGADILRRLLPENTVQHTDKTINGIGGNSCRGPQMSDCIEGAIDVGGTVYKV